jgi:manganese transport protein
MRKTLIWFVISAAFIGPGTVATATSAGAEYGLALLWTIVFAIIACIVLQEGAARINIAANLSLGQAIVKQFSSEGKKISIAMALTIAVVLGCAAYEAGNILGAVSGISLIVGIKTQVATLGIIFIAAVLLYTNRFNLITTFLASIIGIMGLSLLAVAFSLDINSGDLIQGLTIPRIPQGSELLTLGLIGTTVVPYNLFLGSRLAKSQELKSMRRGLSLSVIMGGLISVSLILIGSKVEGPFSFMGVADALSKATGPWATYFFAFGLFAAGLTSAITAPWAASITLTSTIKVKSENKAFKITWMIVLLAGLIFGVSEVKPIPIIILAQAVNGILLPFLAVAILLVLNNKQIMLQHANKWIGNLLLLLIVWVTGILGLLNFLKAIYSTFGIEQSITNTTLVVLSLVSLVITLGVGINVLRQKSILK